MNSWRTTKWNSRNNETVKSSLILKVKIEERAVLITACLSALFPNKRIFFGSVHSSANTSRCITKELPISAKAPGAYYPQQPPLWPWLCVVFCALRPHVRTLLSRPCPRTIREGPPSSPRTPCSPTGRAIIGPLWMPTKTKWLFPGLPPLMRPFSR